MAKSELTDWLKLQVDHAYRKDKNSHADRLRRASCGRCRRAGDLQEQAVQPGSAAVIERGPLAGVARRLLSGRECLQRLRRPALHDRFPASASPPNPRRRRHEDLGRVRRFHVRRNRPDQPTRAAATPATSATPTSSARALSLAARPNSAVPAFDQTGVPFGRSPRRTSDFEDSRKDTAWTPRFSISYKPNADHNIYASYSRGFKGGGFDPRGQSKSAPISTATGSLTG